MCVSKRLSVQTLISKTNHTLEILLLNFRDFLCIILACSLSELSPPEKNQHSFIAFLNTIQTRETPVEVRTIIIEMISVYPANATANSPKCAV